MTLGGWTVPEPKPRNVQRGPLPSTVLGIEENHGDGICTESGSDSNEANAFARRAARHNHCVHDHGEQQRRARLVAVRALRLERVDADGHGVSDVPVSGGRHDRLFDGVATAARRGNRASGGAHLPALRDPLRARPGGQQLPALPPVASARVGRAAAHCAVLSGVQPALRFNAENREQGGALCEPGRAAARRLLHPDAFRSGAGLRNAGAGHSLSR